ncbi:MAG: 4-hydroxy-tetrahydrodipicolinate synthase, partial [Myxococcota bacterium]
MKFEGAMTALVTPMRERNGERAGQVDYDAYGALIDDQIAAGIDGIVAVGTTGESATLAPDEHIEVIKRAVEFCAGRVPVIAGAGGNSTAEALHLSRASAEAGAQALLQVVPYYTKPTQEGLYQHFATIARAVDLPIMLYNVPGRTACDMLPETVARLAEIDNVGAIKEATGDPVRATRIIELCGDRLSVMSGDDFSTFTLYAVGGRGVVSVVSNVLPGAMAAMWDAAAAGDWDKARAQHYAIQPLTRLLSTKSSRASGTKAESSPRAMAQTPAAAGSHGAARAPGRALGP